MSLTSPYTMENKDISSKRNSKEAWKSLTIRYGGMREENIINLGKW